MTHTETRLTEGSEGKGFGYSVTITIVICSLIAIITDTDKSEIGLNMWHKFYKT
jgi:hypothetical protein